MASWMPMENHLSWVNSYHLKGKPSTTNLPSHSLDTKLPGTIFPLSNILIIIACGRKVQGNPENTKNKFPQTRPKLGVRGKLKKLEHIFTIWKLHINSIKTPFISTASETCKHINTPRKIKNMCAANRTKPSNKKETLLSLGKIISFSFSTIMWGHIFRSIYTLRIWSWGVAGDFFPPGKRCF